MKTTPILASLAVSVMLSATPQQATAAAVNFVFDTSLSLQLQKALKKEADRVYTLFGPGGDFRRIKFLEFIVMLIDPDPASFYDGRFSVFYDPLRFELIDVGWLGGWGEDPSLPSPPIDPNHLTGFNLTLQDANASLAATKTADEINGTIDIAFDWGSSPFVAAADAPFNFLAVTLRARQDLVIENTLVRPPTAGSGLMGTTVDSFRCAVGTEQIRECRSETSDTYTVSEVPLPGAAFLLGASLLGLAAAGRRNSRRQLPA